jgi:ABC-type uncharacterized transport system involved in gliding motility auxiliary subunit
LEKSYQVETPTLSDSTTLASDYAAMVIASVRDSLKPAEAAKVQRYVEGGGKVLVLEAGMTVSPQGPFAASRPIGYNSVLKPFGVQIKQDMVYDLKANQVIAVPTNLGRILRAYPYFIRARSTRASPINTDLAEVGLAWASSIDTAGAKPGTVTPLLVTTQAAGVAAGTAMVDPNQDFPTTNLGVRVLAVQVVPKDAKGARLVVVGNAMMGSDQFAQRSPENLVFALNAVDWLAQDEALIAIRAKDRRPPPLVFTSDGLKQGVKYFNVAGLPILIGLFGLLRLVKRRKMADLPYRPSTAPEAA